MGTHVIARNEWNHFFKNFSKRHRGERVTIEVADAGHEGKVLARELPLEGISADYKGTGENDLSIMAGETPQDHIVHSVTRPQAVTFTRARGAIRTIEIRSEDGTRSLLRFTPGPFQQVGAALDTMKVIKPTPHAVIDYAWAGMVMAAPWLFGFRKNRSATINCIAHAAGIIGLSMMTKYPLGALKWIPFPVHGIVEAIAGAGMIADPWIMGFSKNDRARWTHMIAGIGTLAVVMLTDYRAAERED